MKKIKLLLLITLIVITCTGCTVEYNINITKDTVEETISVNDYLTTTRTQKDIMDHYNMWYPTFVNYIPEGETIELEDFTEKVDGIEYHEKKINEINNGFKYTYKYIYPLDKYYDSYILARTFLETTFHEGTNNLVIRTSKENFLCEYDYFESAKINITIDEEVYKLNYTNTSNIDGNTYTWTLDRSNCNDSEIILTLENNDGNSIINDIINNAPNNQTNNNENNSEENTSEDYTLYIFCGILILIILIGYFIFKKTKIKNEKFDV